MGYCRWWSYFAWWRQHVQMQLGWHTPTPTWNTLKCFGGVQAYEGIPPKHFFATYLQVRIAAHFGDTHNRLDIESQLCKSELCYQGNQPVCWIWCIPFWWLFPCWTCHPQDTRTLQTWVGLLWPAPITYLQWYLSAEITGNTWNYVASFNISAYLLILAC